MNHLEKLEKKVITDRYRLKTILDELRLRKRIVFTNGCFDVLHVGHVSYLNRARDLGDILVVGINSDASVKRYKGENRPINQEKNRCLVMAALEAVDFVTLFPEDTPIETLEILQPHVHTKGGDYTVAELPERVTVEGYGGEIVILPFLSGHSTTNIIHRMNGNRD